MPLVCRSARTDRTGWWADSENHQRVLRQTVRVSRRILFTAYERLLKLIPHFLCIIGRHEITHIRTETFFSFDWDSHTVPRLPVSSKVFLNKDKIDISIAFQAMPDRRVAVGVSRSHVFGHLKANSQEILAASFQLNKWLCSSVMLKSFRKIQYQA